jgi:rotatin
VQVLVNVAAHHEGQKALLQSTSSSRILSVLSDLMDIPSGLSSTQDRCLSEAALMLLRNMCFAPEARHHVLAHPRLLSQLMDHTELAADSQSMAPVFASSALWALTYHGEKVSTVVVGAM